jgi:hypothetical protein
VILADTSVWIDHLRSGDPMLEAELLAANVLGHSMVIGELAMGSLRNRQEVLSALHRLPEAVRASDQEAIQLIERRRLFGLGLGFIDVHLLASALLSPAATLWTRDRRLRDAAMRLGVSADRA